MSLQDALADIASKLNTETHVSDWLTITQKMINQFADATLDHQWIHVEPERAAAESPYGDTVAHGFLTLSLIPHLSGNVSADRPRYKGVKMSINYGLNRVRFPHPVLVGSKVRARVVPIAVEEVKGNGIQTVSRVTLELENVDKPACVAETVARLYFE